MFVLHLLYMLMNGFLRIYRNVSAFHGILCHLRKILIRNPVSDNFAGIPTWAFSS